MTEPRHALRRQVAGLALAGTVLLLSALTGAVFAFAVLAAWLEGSLP